MASRLELHEELVKALGSRNVYFQPPESIKMKYPAIVYERNDIKNKHGDDDIYLQCYQYKVTVIDYDPDSEIIKRISRIKMSRFNRHFVSDGLNHDVFTIYN